MSVDEELSKNRIARQGLDLPPDPIAMALRFRDEPYSFALDGSGSRSWGSGRAFSGYGPSSVLRIHADGTAQQHDAAGIHPRHGDPLALLETFVDATHRDGVADDSGFVVVALSYDLRFATAPVRGGRRPAPQTPCIHAAAYDWRLEFDYSSRTWELHGRPGANVDLDAVGNDLRARARRAVRHRAQPTHGPLRPEFSQRDHERGVRRALEYIAAGDIYQVNLAQRFTATGSGAAVDLYAALQRHHPVPFGAFVDAGDFSLVSNSPECFLHRDGDRISTFPIKGTRPRAAGASADRQLRQDLLRDAKERAEHVMVVDLERNDLGRLCRVGSISVPSAMRIESYPTLHHMVSEVSGTLRPNVRLADVLRATFPGGSITGAPKIRAMEVIDELEPVSRGFYTGSIGLVGPSQARLNIAIRTATIDAQGLRYHAGGGIVADSDPQREYAEILLKAQPLSRALAASAA